MRSKGYFWFRFGIISGVCIAILLLTNSVSTYLSVLRRISVENLRRDVAERVSNLDRQLRPGSLASSGHLDTLLNTTLVDSQGRLAWIQVRDASGAVVAQAGAQAAPTFSVQLADAKFRSRQPLYAFRNSNAGELLVEAFRFACRELIRIPHFVSRP